MKVVAIISFMALAANVAGGVVPLHPRREDKPITATGIKRDDADEDGIIYPPWKRDDADEDGIIYPPWKRDDADEDGVEYPPW
ncbi:hypothetical protein BJY01DRAFT_248485 [Aspergillus pseudoustus]|uniref:Uncharacterized protein n=1 Tax=Aspergillus pseudoustus TaxID=1810923 RepID=A0ABR4JUI4_9EURO